MRMQIGGLQKFSLIDYPGKVAAVIFCQGCNFRCPYCHNPELVISSQFRDLIPTEDVTSFLVSRKDKLQGVVVTGGEPTVQPDLKDFLKKIKQMGYAVKLDTNGSSPDVLKEVIEAGLVDFVAMDIKAPLAKYPQVAGIEVDGEAIKTSISLILNSSIDYVFRTTAIKPFLSDQDFADIQTLIAGARRYDIQPFVSRDRIVDTQLLDRGHYSDEEVGELQKKWVFDGKKEEPSQ